MNLVETPKSALARCERIIASGMESFIEVGKALAEVRDSKLYQGEYKTFDDYCEKRWEFGARRGYMLITAAEVVESVNNCSHLPTNEGQARELGKLPKKHRKKAMKAAADAAPKDESGEPKITAAGIASAVEDIKAKYRKPKEPVAEAAPEIVDGMKRPVPEKLVPMFSHGGDFAEIMAGIQRVRKLVESLSEHPWARELRSQSIDIDLKNAYQAVKFAMPHCPCVYCNGAKKKGKCDCCKGMGWMTMPQYRAAPPELKEAVEPEEA